MCLILTILPGAYAVAAPIGAADGTYNDLTALFEDWRSFEKPALRNGAPDYTASTMGRKHAELKAYQARLAAIDTSGWSIKQQVDYHVVRAEMNGLDFHIRVLKPWERDPAFYTSVWNYQSDTPAHEGPTHHALVELWTYTFPLAKADQSKMTAELRTIPPLLEQARTNLTGNARELWVGGTLNIRNQASELKKLESQTQEAGGEFKDALRKAHAATLSFVGWLESEAASKTGPSGIGKDNYTWHLRNVHLVPLSWQGEVDLLKRELARAHASLRLEEHRNRDLPPLKAISSPEEFDRRGQESVTKFMAFLEENKVLPIRGFMDSALRAQIGQFVPEDKRNFFSTAIHFEPNTLNTHKYHWWDLARMREMPHPSPIRRDALLFNSWDSRAEGLATAFEEIMMHAGLYDDNPRVREIVWIMLAQRAARGLGSLYAHANEFTMQDARNFHVKWTPRGWMRDDLDLLGFEQLLYMRQPGYGSCYVTGKYLVDRLIAERSNQLGDDFNLSNFFSGLNAAGVIPMSLIRWQMTGKDDVIRELVSDK
jgi:hypothetical protein